MIRHISVAAVTFLVAVSALLAGQGEAQVADVPETEAAAPLATAAGVGPPTIDSFMAESELRDLQLSPSGRYLATVLRKDKATFLMVTDLESPKDRKATKLGDKTVYGLEWIGDERLVYSAGSSSPDIRFRNGRIQFVGVPQLYVATRDLRDPKRLFEGDKKINDENFMFMDGVMLIPGDTRSFLMSVSMRGRLDLLKIDVETGAWTEVAAGTDLTIAWYIDRAGKPALRLDSNRRGTEIRVFAPEVRGDKARWKQVLKVRVDRETDKPRDFSIEAPGPSPELYYVLGKPPGADRIGVHLYNFEKEAFDKEIYVNPEVDVAVAMFDQSSGAYVGAAFWGDTLAFAFADPKMQAHFNGLFDYFGKENNVAFVDRSDDQATWLLFVSGPRDPGSYHIYNMTEANAREIGKVNASLKKEELGPSRVVSYAARDGKALRGYLTLPPGLAEGAKPPLVVYPHGGPESRDMMSYDVRVQFLATRGYAVFQPNFRGSSGFGDAFVKSGERQFGRAMQTDVDDGVQHLVAEGLIDGGRICVMGESYGGYVALMGVVQAPDVYRCAIAASAPTDLYRQVTWERKEEGSDSDSYLYWVRQIGDPKKDRAEMEAYSPAKLAARIQAPVLLGHGERDSVVPFEQTEIMEKALQAAGKKVRVVRMPDSGHGFYGQNARTWLEEIERFLSEHLPTSPASRSVVASGGN